MGVFGGIGGTSPSGSRGVFLTDGEYRLEVQRCKVVDSKKNGKTFFVVEGKVLGTSNAEKHPENQLVTWLVKLGGDWPEYSLADIKAFAMAAAKASAEEVDEEFMESVTADDGDLLSGNEVICNVTTIATKAGGEFGKHTFMPAAKVVVVSEAAEA
jgi:hypothetical protein